MEEEAGFRDVLEFFRRKPPATPGDREYAAALCQTLVRASSAEQASIWQLDGRNQLHPIYSTDLTEDQLRGMLLGEGEGIGGAAVVSRETIAVPQAFRHPHHDRRLDDRVGLRTRSMISAPILFGDSVYGVVNILNHETGQTFSPEWEERLSAVGALYGAALAAAGRLERYGETSKRRRGERRGSPDPSKPRTVLVGASCPIQEALQLCMKAAKSTIPVLIRGETGTGKELAARRIHEASPWASGPFVEVNCAAIAETLLESELFGHVKGAFTGATRNRPGKFLAATGGTIFLDEIGEMSQACQVKILGVLQDRRFSPVGSERAVECDTRVIAATNRDPWSMVEDGAFREDLLYRLCGIEIIMPPLRDRREDIPLLVRHFLLSASEDRDAQTSERPTWMISPEALRMLVSFRWPGNVRQLQQAVLAAAAISEAQEIQPGDLPSWFRHGLEEQGRAVGPDIALQAEGRGDEEDRLRYLRALDATKYPGTGRFNLTAAARDLGIPRKTLMYRLRKLGVIG